jgi:Rx N-terminal domain
MLTVIKCSVSGVRSVRSSIWPQGRSENLDSWLASLRDAAYDAHDILDECEYYLLKDRVECCSQAGISFSRIFSCADDVSAFWL